MNDLACKHCGTEIGFADALIADVEGWECPEPRPHPDHPEMLTHEHEWEEIRA
jgi:hypothetical protein